MKAVILAGGNGTRLKPITDTINKHLLPVGREPMIFHPIKKAVEAGITEILIVTGGDCSDGFLTLIKDGKHLGVKQLYYAHQVGAGGIAEALKLGQSFVGNEKFVVLLGDNIFTEPLTPHVQEYQKTTGSRARVHLIKVPDPERFGCPRLSPEGKILEIIEKPTKAPSDFAVVGIYFYPHTVFTEVLPHLRPSKRGELEVSDITNFYLRNQRLDHGFLKGQWSEAGTWPSWEEANRIMQKND